MEWRSIVCGHLGLVIQADYKSITDIVNEDQDYRDSARFDKLLEEALQLATVNIGKDIFSDKREIIMDDSSSATVEISSGFHFSETTVHLIVRRSTPNDIFIDLYTKEGRKYIKAGHHKQWLMEYLNDTIFDVNGDKLKDFVVNAYGANGCCLKAFSTVYLSRPDHRSFSNEFWFINPTFSPKEGKIRGVCYGHPGETAMYTYRWDKDNVDTVEYISFQKNDEGIKTGKLIISKERPDGRIITAVKVLNDVPAEYQRIEGYAWFTGAVTKTK